MYLSLYSFFVNISFLWWVPLAFSLEWPWCHGNHKKHLHKLSVQRARYKCKVALRWPNMLGQYMLRQWWNEFMFWCANIRPTLNADPLSQCSPFLIARSTYNPGYIRITLAINNLECKYQYVGSAICQDVLL